MIKKFYRLLCWLKNKHIALSDWENQHAFGCYCKCGFKQFIHKRQLNYIKNGKNSFTIIINRQPSFLLGGK